MCHFFGEILYSVYEVHTRHKILLKCNTIKEKISHNVTKNTVPAISIAIAHNISIIFCATLYTVN